MNRRQFLRNASLAAAGVVAADQLELIERLGWTRRLFPGWSRPVLHGDGIHDDTAALQALFDGKEVWDRQARRVIGEDGRFALYSTTHRIAGTVYGGQPHQRGHGHISHGHFIGDNQPGPLFDFRVADERFPFASSFALAD